MLDSLVQMNSAVSCENKIWSFKMAHFKQFWSAFLKIVKIQGKILDDDLHTNDGRIEIRNRSSVKVQDIYGMVLVEC